ncbi:MAG: molybdopterin molybdenumtransferase MoeA, partial [Gammaproteobacteria bacterium]|nr:molybdopterin molybdenumtransferase MoeA [Gammaproteobacteria bacterium]
LPEGADAVVIQENCQYDNEEVTILSAEQGRVSPGNNVLKKGEDIESGQTLLRAGRRLRPQDMG